MDEILAEAGIKTVLTGIRMPRVNSIMERWVRSCRHELLDRCLVWNEHHLRHALREYEGFYNQHRAHQALNQAAPLRTRPRSDHGSRANYRPECTPTRPARRRPPRVLTCGLNCTEWNFRQAQCRRPATLAVTHAPSPNRGTHSFVWALRSRTRPQPPGSGGLCPRAFLNPGLARR
ncbi:integrase core domain-containing protein [Nonomuraea sp. CA-141351]|uniref:integrase core domain-containing protein n=1 Tax=Nonomuraea sp. CA-141351 TaxID=3239996 RepID=UPI003D8E64AD